MSEQPTRGVMIILDGLGDCPNPQLDGKTPLEAAHTPNLDKLAAGGLCGMSDPLKPGVPVGTHTGTAVLLGIPTLEAARLTRGPVEAAGVGVGVLPGDVTIRANFATLKKVKGGLEILDRRAGRISEGVEGLAGLLSRVDLGRGVHATLHAATQHRAVLHLTGPGLSAGVTDTDPGTDGGGSGGALSRVLKSVPNDSSEGSLITANALNHFIRLAHKVLRSAELNLEREQQGLLPANGLITRGAGRLEPLSNLISHYRLRAALISGESTVIGLGRLLGYHVITRPEYTAMADTDIAGKLDAACGSLVENDIAFVHLKAPDICSHDRNPVEKKAFLERFDRELGCLMDGRTAIAVTGDHSTNSMTGGHSGDPVPSLLYIPGGRSDSCRTFGESGCLQGGLGRLYASALLSSLLGGMGVISQFRRSDAALHGFGGP